MTMFNSFLYVYPRVNPGYHPSRAEVYLYLVNYAESNSDLAILAINTLQKAGFFLLSLKWWTSEEWWIEYTRAYHDYYYAYSLLCWNSFMSE